MSEEEREDYFNDDSNKGNQSNNGNNSTGNKQSKADSKATKVIKQSTTDPESGFMHRDGKPQGFFYLDYRTVDS